MIFKHNIHRLKYIKILQSTYYIIGTASIKLLLYPNSLHLYHYNIMSINGDE